MSLPTPADVRAYLEGYGINRDTISDAWIADVQTNSVMSYVNRVTRQDWGAAAPVTYVEYFDGNGSDLLILPRRPIASIVDITFIGGTIYPITISAVQLLSAEGILKARSKISEGVERRFFQQGKRNIRVTYTAGGPPDAKLCYAVKLLVAERCLGNIANRTGGGDLSVQSHSRSYGPRGKYGNLRTEMKREAMGILRNFMTGVAQ